MKRVLYKCGITFIILLLSLLYNTCILNSTYAIFLQKVLENTLNQLFQFLTRKYILGYCLYILNGNVDVLISNLRIQVSAFINYKIYFMQLDTFNVKYYIRLCVYMVIAAQAAPIQGF